MTHENTENSRWKMSGAERECYAAARESMREAAEKRRGSPAEGKPVSKSEAAKLGKEMLLAVEKCDQESSLSLLFQGAEPNARNEEGRTALDLALEACGKGADLHALCGELFERGGWVAPERYSSMASEFGKTAGRGLPLSDALREACVRKTRSLLLGQSGSWSLAKAGMAKIAPKISEADILLELGALWRFDVLRQAALAGAVLKSGCLAGAANSLAWKNTRDDKPKMFNSGKGKELAALLGEPAAASALEGKSMAWIFNAAAWESAGGAILALLDAGMRPSETWDSWVDIPASDAYAAAVIQHSAPLLVVAAASPVGRGAFDALLRLEPALKAARERAPSPRVLALIPVQRLLELREAGVDIGGVDAVGTVAHWWAALDSSPRAGWATLAASAPDVFEKLDAAGKTAADRMADKLRAGKPQDDFRASLSRIESRAIRKEIGPAKRTAPAQKSSRRL